MPHAIPTGEALRRDADRLTRLTMELCPAPDFDAAAAIPFDRPEYLAHLRAEWEAGRVRAFVFRRAGVAVGQLFFEIVGDAFRIHGGHTLPAAVTSADFCEAMEFLETEARRLGCKSIVTDTSRPGVLRHHAAAGWKVAEVILTKPLR